MRKRINPARVCTSENYKLSHQIHASYIRQWHSLHIEELQTISDSIIPKQKYYVKCFGELVEITEDEANRMKQYMPIITQ